jgi:hypothetical protein
LVVADGGGSGGGGGGGGSGVPLAHLEVDLEVGEVDVEVAAPVLSDCGEQPARISRK